MLGVVVSQHPEMMADCWEWLESKEGGHGADHLDIMAINPLAQFDGDARSVVSDLIEEMAGLSNSPYFHIGAAIPDVNFVRC